MFNGTHQFLILESFLQAAIENTNTRGKLFVGRGYEWLLDSENLAGAVQKSLLRNRGLMGYFENKEVFDSAVGSMFERYDSAEIIPSNDKGVKLIYVGSRSSRYGAPDIFCVNPEEGAPMCSMNWRKQAKRLETFFPGFGEVKFEDQKTLGSELLQNVS